MANSALLVVNRHLPFLRDAAGLPDLAGEALGDRLTRLDVSAEQRDALFAVPGDGTPGWSPRVGDDLVMSIPVVDGNPRDYDGKLHGAPMDFHGQGAPLPSLRSLAVRKEWNTQGEGVLVGVVDTGMRSHPWLDGGYLATAQDFEPYDRDGDEGPPPAQAGHGTFIAGVVLQQAPGAGVWVERALEPSGEGAASSVANAALALARRGVHVLNLSLGCFSEDRRFGEVMADVAEELLHVNPDLVIVAAAGNLRDEKDPARAFWPAALPQVVAVGAVADDDSHDGERPGWAAWSNRGPWVDFAASGTDLLSTYLATNAQSGEPASKHTGWAYWSGTSFAAAVVSGAIARTMTDGGGMPARSAVEVLRDSPLRTRRDEISGAPSVPVVRALDWTWTEAAPSAAVSASAP